ncbi:MAG: ABC transporter ATP-binding protein [Hyphomicrobiaceae bacterium]|nr:ABC transporter ATP-binding protein [Hyphomicrobiaceae bacterium]
MAVAGAEIDMAGAGTLDRSVASNAATALIAALGISKRFGSTQANDKVDLIIQPGEIHALLGENGAGKSTLVKILYGALQADSGALVWEGTPVAIANPAAARALGIGMVFQHFSLFEALTVAENIALAMPGKLDLAGLSKTIAEVSQVYGLPLVPTARVADLSVGERQRIEIVRALLQEPKLLIMDEPTSVLTPQEADQLFLTLERLKSEGKSILYISHRLDEVKRLCDAATIMRHGKVVGHVDPRAETAASLARLMVGADIHVVKGRAARDAGAVRFALRQLTLPKNGPFSVALDHIDLEVRAGEVVCIAGVAGNGQTELFDAISGERVAASAGAVLIDAQPVGRHGPNDRRRRGAAFVAEERLGHGAVPVRVLSDNVLLTRHASDAGLTGGGWLSFLRKGAANAVVDRVTQAYDVRKGKRDPEARSLSGGNLQKFVVGREIDRAPGVLVVNQPTWGVDAGAAALIRQALVDLAATGSAVLVISQDLDEIFEIADRIAVIHHGALSPAYPAATMTLEKVGLLMGGAHPEKLDTEGQG